MLYSCNNYIVITLRGMGPT